MIPALVVGSVVWLAVALTAAVAIGRAMRIADQHEQPAPVSGRPHLRLVA